MGSMAASAAGAAAAAASTSTSHDQSGEGGLTLPGAVLRVTGADIGQYSPSGITFVTVSGAARGPPEAERLGGGGHVGASGPRRVQADVGLKHVAEVACHAQARAGSVDLTFRWDGSPTRLEVDDDNAYPFDPPP